MKPFATTNIKLMKLTVLLLLLHTAVTNAAILKGDIAIIGRTNNSTPDVFTFVTLTSISAGEVIYFSDNGITSGTSFRGATLTDGDGNENLLKWESTGTVAAGTIISTNATSANFSFTKTGLVPGATTGSFADLNLSQSGDQITAFQASTTLPLMNATTFLHLFDDTNAFESAASAATGQLPTGLSSSDAVLLNSAVAGTIAFNTSILSSGTKIEWLSAINNASNWTATSLPSGNISVVPETGTTLLGALGALLLLRRRRA